MRMALRRGCARRIRTSMLAERLEALWYRPPRLAYVLMPVALIYRGITGLRRALYRWRMLPRTRLGVPVIVIGNVTVGGTGKTPLTLWLVERLAAQGMHPGVVCKSYAAAATSPSRVQPGDDPRLKGDEATLIATRVKCSVWSGPDRVAAARAMLAHDASVDVIVCDDGLQHYALDRDCEIAVLDAMRGFGNGFALPAGPLREPRARLRTVHAVVANGTDAITDLPEEVPCFRMSLQGEELRNVAEPGRVVTPGELAGKKLAAIAGIGNPRRFFDHLHGLGLTFEAHAFPDHFEYRPSDLRSLQAEAVLMTEKDAIKCARFEDPRLWMLPVSAAVSDALLCLVLGRIRDSRQSR
jgi:tetraacyldisaccharide 4'-kinase